MRMRKIIRKFVTAFIGGVLGKDRYFATICNTKEGISKKKKSRWTKNKKSSISFSDTEEYKNINMCSGDGFYMYFKNNNIEKRCYGRFKEPLKTDHDTITKFFKDMGWLFYAAIKVTEGGSKAKLLEE